MYEQRISVGWRDVVRDLSSTHFKVGIQEHSRWDTKQFPRFETVYEKIRQILMRDIHIIRVTPSRASHLAFTSSYVSHSDHIQNSNPNHTTNTREPPSHSRQLHKYVH